MARNIVCVYGFLIITAMWSNNVKLLWNSFLSRWLSFLTYNLLSLLAEQSKCDKFCKEISAAPDALQLNNFCQKNKTNTHTQKKSALVSKGCSSAKWKHPFIEHGAIRALSKLKNTTGRKKIIRKLQALLLFFQWYAAKRLQRWGSVAWYTCSCSLQNGGVSEQSFMCFQALLEMVGSLQKSRSDIYWWV